MQRVLFVDDEPNVLEAIRRMLHPLRHEITMEFASNGREALRVLAELPCDVLVTDVRMPVLDGIGLLAETIRLHPQVVRIVLSGTADYQMTLRSVTLAHQYLMKPCDAVTLRNTLENAFTLRHILDNSALTALIGRVQSLPSVPAVYLKLMEALQASETSPATLGEIISEDIGMSAKVLQWINSPLFGTRRNISSPKDAAIYLGVETVRAMALTESVFCQFDTHNRPGFPVEDLRSHSLQVATLARDIARARHFPPAQANDVFLGGLMHDIGKLVLGCNFPREYKDVITLFSDLDASLAKEREHFGTTHAEVGGYLLWLWGLPKAVTDIVVRHHSASVDLSGTVDPAALVHLADKLLRQGPDQASEHDVHNLRLEVA